MEHNKDQKMDENIQPKKDATDSTNDMLQTERLIDPGNEHHHDGVTEDDDTNAGSKDDAGKDAKGSTENKPG